MNGSAIILIVVGLFLALFFPFYPIQWIGYAVVLVIALSFLYSRVIRAGLLVERAPMDLVTYRYQIATVVIRLATIRAHSTPATATRGCSVCAHAKNGRSPMKSRA